MARTLYVNRPVLNAADIIAWAKANGFEKTVTPDDMHVTIAFSDQPIEWPEPIENRLAFMIANPQMAMFGPNKDCAVLKFESQELYNRWKQICDMGASWKWSDYSPHITISYDAAGMDADQIEPYKGKIVLGPEEFSPVNDDWKAGVVEKAKKSQASVGYSEGKGSDKCENCVHYEAGSCELVAGTIKPDMWCKLFEKEIAKMDDDFIAKDRLQKRGARNSRADQMTIQQLHDHTVVLGAACSDHDGNSSGDLVASEDSYDKVARIAKIDESLGLVFGYAVVCTKDGQPYYDLNIDKQDDGTYKRVPEHITEPAMLKAAVDFAKSARAGNEMHAGPDTGEYVFVFPLTADIAKAFDIQTRTTGLMIAYKPTPEVFAKFKSGDYTGFSIEGRRVSVTEAE